ncbi:MAG: anthranilate synthase component I [Solirubrobacterales bacterium]
MSVVGATTSSLPLTPTLDEARELAREFNVIPVRHSFVDDCETPVSAFLKLRGRGPAFLLESAEQGQVGRYSFLGFRPRALLRFADGRLDVSEAGDERSVPCEDPFAAVTDLLSGYRVAPLDGLPPFAGGAVGMFGYDLVRTVECLPEPNPDDIGTPDMALMVSDALVVFDHVGHEVTILVNAFVNSESDVDEAYARAVELIERARGLLGEPVPRAEATARPHDPASAFEPNMTQQQFEAVVSRAVEYIHAGDAFQIVPSQRWSGHCPVEPFSVYRGLRVVNPSPYMYFLEFDDFSIVGASPEPLLKVEGRRAEIWPIAGTRPRGATTEEDLRVANELLSDPKERAEHVMLVDLARNDLGRVCEYGSVEVDDLMRVETYSHVLHIVSQVSGTLTPEYAALDALRACLPAGTLSGAPKIRAMEIIDELEPAKRGFYGGAIGYLSYSGDLDTCIHIRTLVAKDGRAHVQAGAGVVADSDPGYEYRETLAKARAVFAAIELACDQAEWE